MPNLFIHSMKSMLLVFILTSVSTAQVKFGATLCGVSSNLSFDPDEGESPDAQAGFTLGAVLEYPVNDILNIRSGASLTDKGAQFSEEELGVKFETSFNFSYLTVPILAQYKLNSSNTTPYVLGGLDIGILMSAEGEVTVSGTGVSDITITIDLKDSLSTTDIAFNIGAGYMMEMGNAKVYGEILYSLGLLDVNTPDIDDDVSIKTKGIIIGVGYIF